MLTEIKACGLSSIEIGYNFTTARLNELIPLLEEFNIRVTSVHNFCPLPEENAFGRFFTNYYFLSALDDDERGKAVFYTRQTIDTAKMVGARTVVIHAGAVEFDGDYTKELMVLFNSGAIESEKAANIREILHRERTFKKVPYIEATMKSLDEITEYAAAMDMEIGLENRYYANEIPNNDEALTFLKEFSDRGLGYWHDVGHSCAQEHLMMIEKDSLLNKLGGYLIGLHLHDIRGLKDHLSPLAGEFDFSRISSYLEDKKMLKIIEAHQPSKPAEIQAAIKYFNAKNWL
jgi:sugar phosphate isomerase/epimerase